MSLWRWPVAKVPSCRQGHSCHITFDEPGLWAGTVTPKSECCGIHELQLETLYWKALPWNGARQLHDMFRKKLLRSTARFASLRCRGQVMQARSKAAGGRAHTWWTSNPSKGVRRHAAPGAAARDTRAHEPGPTAVRKPWPLGRTCRELPGRAQAVCNGVRPQTPGMRGGVCVSPPAQAQCRGRAPGRPATKAVHSLVPRCDGHQRGARRYSCPVRRRWLHLYTGFAADSRRGPFQRCPARSENTGSGTRSTVVTQGIECTSTPAPPWPEWHGQPQSSEQHDSEARSSSRVGTPEPSEVRLAHGIRQGLPGTASALAKPGQGQKEGCRT